MRPYNLYISGCIIAVAGGMTCFASLVLAAAFTGPGQSAMPPLTKMGMTSGFCLAVFGLLLMAFGAILANVTPDWFKKNIGDKYGD